MMSESYLYFNVRGIKRERVGGGIYEGTFRDESREGKKLMILSRDEIYCV